jgi:hypothetical protein
MSKYSRDKGQRGEREVCHLLSEHLNRPISRELGASRDGGCDIKVTMGTFVYYLEVKLYRKITQANVADWWEQAKRQTEEHGKDNLNPIPVLIYRQSHWKYWEVVIPLNYMLWQLSATKYKMKDEVAPRITTDLKYLTHLMLLDTDSTISKGTMDIYIER